MGLIREQSHLRIGNTDSAEPPRFRRAAMLVPLLAFAVLVMVLGIYLASEKRPAVAGLVPAASAPKPVPDLRFQNSQGKTLSLSDFRGKFVLLNVWATWCVPCRKEMPALDRVQQQLGGPNFEVVALSIDRGGVAAVKPFYEEIDMRVLAIYVDASSDAVATLRTVGIPTTLLVDREGRELWRKTGPAEWDSPTSIESLRRQIGATPH